MNIVILTGHLGANPETTAIDNGTNLTKFSIATNKRWSDGDESQERTDWHRVVTFGRLADNCQKFLKKGSHVAIRGELRTNSWEDDNGNNRRSVEVLAKSVEFLDKAPVLDEDIPF